MNVFCYLIFFREKGGAYGGGAKHGKGIFSFYSYRLDKNYIIILLYRVLLLHVYMYVY